MHTALDVPFVDTRARQLTWQLGLPPQPALAVTTVPMGGLDVELRLLGASHQVLVTSPDHLPHHPPGGAGRVMLWSETVACLPGGEPLPDATGTARDGVYRLRSVVVVHRAADLGLLADRLVERLGGRGDALVGEFAGQRHAVTAMVTERRGHDALGWHTWHAYPGTGELVTTATTLSLVAQGVSADGGGRVATWA